MNIGVSVTAAASLLIVSLKGQHPRRKPLLTHRYKTAMEHEQKSDEN